MRLVERHESSLALRCWVYVTAYASNPSRARTIAEGGSSVIIGSLSGQRAVSALRTSRAKKGMLLILSC